MTEREIRDLGDFYHRIEKANTDLFVCWYDYAYVVKDHGDEEMIERRLNEIENQIRAIRSIWRKNDERNSY